MIWCQYHCPLHLTDQYNSHNGYVINLANISGYVPIEIIRHSVILLKKQRFMFKNAFMHLLETYKFTITSSLRKMF